MPMADVKRELLQHFARIAKAVSSPARLELLELLAQGEKTVEALAREAGLGVKNTSGHLRALRSASLVATRRQGTYVFYRLADPVVGELIHALHEVARRRLAEVRELIRDYFEARDTLEALNARELLGRMRKGKVVVLDVRPEDEYLAGHIAGAVSIPEGELRRRLDELPADKEIVAYCRGPYCVLAVEAVEFLRRRGLRARRLREGFPEWRDRGFPVAVGAEAERGAPVTGARQACFGGASGAGPARGKSADEDPIHCE